MAAGARRMGGTGPCSEGDGRGRERGRERGRGQGMEGGGKGRRQTSKECKQVKVAGCDYMI